MSKSFFLFPVFVVAAWGCGQTNSDVNNSVSDAPRVTPPAGVWGAQLSCVFPEGVRRPCLVEIAVGSPEAPEDRDTSLTYIDANGKTRFVNVRVHRLGSSVEISSRQYFAENRYQTFFAGDFIKPKGSLPQLQNHLLQTFTLLPFSPFNGRPADIAITECVLGETSRGWKRTQTPDAATCQAAQWSFRKLTEQSDIRTQYLDFKGINSVSESTSSRKLQVLFTYNTPVENSRLFAVDATQRILASGSTFTSAGAVSQLF